MRHPTEGLSLYCFSKFSLEGFPAALSYELLGQGIVVKIVEPGGVTSTSFGKRSGAEAQGVTTLPSDEKFVRIRRKFSPDSVHRAPRPKRMWPK
jgi:short-subunit dehydrogenase